MRAERLDYNEALDEKKMLEKEWREKMEKCDLCNDYCDGTPETCWRQRARTFVILAMVDVSGPVPMVVNVNTYSDENICVMGNVRLWKLATIEMAADLHGFELIDKQRKEEFVCQKLRENGHEWAIPIYTGETRLPHYGR